MKKVLLAAIVLMSAQAGFSQVSKGQWLAGGNVTFASSKHGDYKETNTSIAPAAGYFFIDQFAGGLRASYGVNNPSGDDATTMYTVAPFVRYYFLASGEKVNIFVDGQYGFGSAKSGGASASINQYAFSAGPAVFLTPNTALEFAIGYSSTGGKYYGDDRMSTIGLNIGFQIHLGNGGGSKK